MLQMQCPAGEHCIRKDKREVCLMWHPPLVTSGSNNVDKKLRDEEERQVQAALKKSLEPEKVYCQFCGAEVETREQLQDHHLNCVAIEETKLTFAEDDKHHCPTQGREQYIQTEFVGVADPVVSSPLLCAKIASVLPVRRKSSRTRRKTEKMEEYTRELKNEKKIVENKEENDEEDDDEDAFYSDEEWGDNKACLGGKTDSGEREKSENDEKLSLDTPNHRILVTLEDDDDEKEDEEINNNNTDTEKIDTARGIVVEEEIIPVCIEELRPLYSGECGDRRLSADNEFLSLASNLDGETCGTEVHVLVDDTQIPNENLREKCCHNWDDINELMEKLNEKERRIEWLENNAKGLGKLMDDSRLDKTTLLGEKSAQEQERIKMVEEINELTSKMGTLEERNNAMAQNIKVLTDEKQKAELEKDFLKDKNKKLVVNNQVEIKNVQDEYQEANKVVTQLQMKLKETEENLKESNSNVNSLVGQVRLREQELEELQRETMDKQLKEKEKDEKKANQIEISQFSKRLDAEKERAEKLEQALIQARDENTRIKNKMKEITENSNGNKEHTYAEFKQFKDHVLREIADLKKDKEKHGVPEKKVSSEGTPEEEDNGKTKKKKRKKKKKQAHKNKQHNERTRTASEISSSEEEDNYDSAVETDASQDVNEKQRERKTLVISTSITRDIRPARFNDRYEFGNVWFARKRGWKIKQIKEDVFKNLKKGDCDEVIVQIGGNDLQDMYAPELITRSAVNIIETAQICKDRGAKTVFIGGVTERKYEYAQERCEALNKELQELCRHNGFIFIDNSNIRPMEHLYDRVHLNDPGTAILADNYLNSLRTAFHGKSV